MAKIFRKLYHEISSSWDFRHLSRNIDEKLIKYEILRDQDAQYILSFHLLGSYTMPTEIRFLYNMQNDEVLSHNADLKNEIKRSFYNKYVEFAYQSISTQELQKIEITIFSNRICKLNEYLQNQYQNITYQIEGFYDVDTNVLKVYVKNLNLESFSRVINYLSKVTDKDDASSIIQYIRNLDEIYDFFTIDELNFIKELYFDRKSIGAKNQYISLTRESFVKLIPYIKNLQNKFSILETGEKLIFAEEPLSLNLYVSKVDEHHFKLALSESHKVHQFFVYHSTYLLSDNIIYKVSLPFDDTTVIAILENRFFFKKTELVYYKTIVGRQISLFNNYLDFEENIDFPDIAEDVPSVYIIVNDLNKSKKDKSKKVINKITDIAITFDSTSQETEKSEIDNVSPISIFAYFEYNDGKKIPVTISVVKENLFKLSFIDSDRWYQLPDDLLYKVREFVVDHLFFNPTCLNEFEWVIDKPQEISYVKNNLYDKAQNNWNIIISDELKKDFIKTINLVPDIEISADEEIDWFAYNVVYRFQNIELTQDILRNFFKSGAKFLTAPDGSNIKIGNREIFDEIENMIYLSNKDADYYHKMAIYRLPWIYELKKINPSITIYGDEYLEEMYSALTKRAQKTPVTPHYTLKPVMRSYQKAGYEWLKMLERFRLNGILADEMGLGKTLQAISVLTDLPPDSKSLIVCPKTLLFNWVAEIEKFNHQLTYVIYEGTKDIRTNLLNIPAQVIICSYNLIQNDLNEFNQIYFDYVILDEAQHIKNHITLRAKAIKKLKARHKLAMTGTPLENSIIELWSVFDFLMPGYLPPLKQMKDFVINQNTVTENDKKNPTVTQTKHQEAMQKIRHYIAPFILRRKKKDVLIELPDKQEQAIFCTMTEKQETHYLHVLEAVKNEIFGQKSIDIKTGLPSQTTGPVNHITMLAALTRLRQICDHPGLINEDWLSEPEISGKLNTLRELIQDAIDNGRKILIFSQYLKMLKLIKDMVVELNIPHEYMDGNTKDRKNIINHFNNNEKIRLFLISLKTGGFGINLTAADTVILVDPWWNPMIENQAIDRVHRIGQTKKVIVYKLITRGSVEEKIMVLQKKKRDLFENVIDQGEAILKRLDNDDLRKLFEYKDLG